MGHAVISIKKHTHIHAPSDTHIGTRPHQSTVCFASQHTLCTHPPMLTADGCTHTTYHLKTPCPTPSHMTYPPSFICILYLPIPTITLQFCV